MLSCGSLYSTKFQDVDLVAADLSQNKERSAAVDMLTMPLKAVHRAGLYKRFQTDNSGITLFLRPFQSLVWLSVLAGLSLSTVFFWILSWQPGGISSPQSQTTSEILGSLGNSFYFCLGILLTQCKCILLSKNNNSEQFHDSLAKQTLRSSQIS